MVTDQQLVKSLTAGFAFLRTEFSFRAAEPRCADSLLEIAYRNRTTGVRISFDAHQHYLFVTLGRLVDGQFVPSPGEIRPNTVLDTYDLDDLLVELGVETTESLEKRALDTTSKPFSEIVAERAAQLRKHASNVLRGDFSIFSRLDRRVKARARAAAHQKWGERAGEFGW